MTLKQNPGEWFGKHVGQHITGWDVVYGDQVTLHAITNKMMTCINMLCPHMVRWVLSESLSAFIVHV